MKFLPLMKKEFTSQKKEKKCFTKHKIVYLQAVQLKSDIKVLEFTFSKTEESLVS